MKMNSILTLGLLGLSISSLAQGSSTYAGSIPNCVARFTFDGNLLTDSSASANNGVLFNTVSAVGWRDAPNEGAKFNGTSSYGNVPSSLSLKITNGTILALVKPTGFYSGPCQGTNIIQKGNDGNNGAYLMRLSDNDFDHDCDVSTPNKIMLQSGFGADGDIFNIKPVISANKWYFFASTYENGVEKKLYQVEMDTGNYAAPTQAIWTLNTAGHSLGTNDNALNIGYLNSPQYPYWFTGTMDEVVIFDRVLDHKELADAYDFLWNKGKPAPTRIKEANIASEVSYQRNGDHYSFTTKDNNTYDAILVDMLGKEIKTFKLNNNSRVDLSGFASQVFMLNIVGQKGRGTIKLVK